MRLSEIDVQGLGQFLETPAGFEIQRYHLPQPWDYIYTNGKLLLRIRQDGCANLQLGPPAGDALFSFDKDYPVPAMLVYFQTEQGELFSNFWNPRLNSGSLSQEPDQYRCRFTPAMAGYELHYRNWTVITRLFLADNSPYLIMNLEVKNHGKKKSSLRMIPVLKPRMASMSLAPWDVPALYQTGSFFRERNDLNGFVFEARDPGGNLSKRWYSVMVTDFPATQYEISLSRFTGKGNLLIPEGVVDSAVLKEMKTKKFPLGEIRTDNAVIGQAPVGVLAGRVMFTPGMEQHYNFVFGKNTMEKDQQNHYKKSGLSPAIALLNPQAQEKILKKTSRYYEKYFQVNRIQSPDEAFNQYINEWLPLQLDWVSLLDRGWPSGMRGTRDAAQDANGMLYWDVAIARQRILEILGVQRRDGWFPRQYSTSGKWGKHDLREYVDSGLWVWELAFDYLCQSREFKLLTFKTDWLDADKKETVLTHLLQILDYYLEKKNIGEHGLCKIREGDWNDSVNRAGLEGIGESVMVSFQLVLALNQAVELLSWYDATNKTTMYKTQILKYTRAAKTMNENLLQHALNNKGYFNGVFNDDRKWIFSPSDPDGQLRISGAVNSYSIISGVATSKIQETVFHALDCLKGPYGWRLFFPPLGNPPIEKLGRVGTGDLAAGLAENGTPYNHGAQGFLARAYACAGRGNQLLEVLRYLLPYDQEAHSVAVTRTPPYAVVNHYKEALGIEGRGGDLFLSGTISTALRVIYRDLLGFHPVLQGVVINPTIPSDWKRVSATLSYLDGQVELEILNPRGKQCGVKELYLNGEPVTATYTDTVQQQEVCMIPCESFQSGKKYRIKAVLG